MVQLSLTDYTLSTKDQIKRMFWLITWTLLAKPFPRKTFNSWKLFLLRIFGAKIHNTANVYSSVRVYAPWNLEMGAYSCLAPEVDCYNVDKVFIGSNCTVSQKSYL